MTLVSKPICGFTGCEDIQPHYTAWFDPDLGILHHISSRCKNAIAVCETRDGYLVVKPSKQSCSKASVSVHRLVCEFFNGAPPAGKHEVNHINHNRSDNRAVNLEWASRWGNTIMDPDWLFNIRSSLSIPIIVTIAGKSIRYESCKDAALVLGLAYRGAFLRHLKPLLKGEVDQVTYYSRKIGDNITARLA